MAMKALSRCKGKVVRVLRCDVRFCGGVFVVLRSRISIERSS